MSATSAEAGWTRLTGADASAESFPLRVRLEGEPILVFRTPAGLRGVERACPHQNASFVDARLVGNGAMLRCAQHNYTFRLDDGRGVNCPGYRIAVYEVKVEDGALYARRCGMPGAASTGSGAEGVA